MSIRAAARDFDHRKYPGRESTMTKITPVTEAALTFGPDIDRWLGV